MDPDIIEQMILQRIKTEARSIRKREGIRRVGKGRAFSLVYSAMEILLFARNIQKVVIYIWATGEYRKTKKRPSRISDMSAYSEKQG